MAWQSPPSVSPVVRILAPGAGSFEGGTSICHSLVDIDLSTRNSVQPFALQYRLGNSGNYINVPTAFVADASFNDQLIIFESVLNPVTLPEWSN